MTKTPIMLVREDTIWTVLLPCAKLERLTEHNNSELPARHNRWEIICRCGEVHVVERDGRRFTTKPAFASKPTTR